MKRVLKLPLFVFKGRIAEISMIKLAESRGWYQLLGVIPLL